MCFRVRFMIKQVVCWLWCSNISKNNSYINFVLSMTSITFLISVSNFVMLLLLWFSSAPTCIVCSVVQCSSHDYWIIFCIAHWNCISVSVHVTFYFEVLLPFMFIFETENRIKLSSHNTGRINHPISLLFKKPITSLFWMLHEKNRLKLSLRTSSLGEPLLTAMPEQAVCALRSLSITGGIQNLIICVKKAWSEHRDRGVNIR